MTTLNWDWLAGFFDGEGSCSTLNGYGTNLCPVITISQSGKIGYQVLDDIRKFLTAAGVTHVTAVKSKRDKICSRSPSYALEIHSIGVAEFLTRIWPLLHVKRVAAQDVLRAMKIFPVMRTAGRKGRIASFPVHYRTNGSGYTRYYGTSRGNA